MILHEAAPVVIVLEENGDAVTLPVMWDAYEPKKEEGILCVCGAAEDTEKKALAEIHYEKKKSMENKVRDKEVLVSFPAGSVTLKPGSMFYEAQEKMAEFLKKQTMTRCCIISARSRTGYKGRPAHDRLGRTGV